MSLFNPSSTTPSVLTQFLLRTSVPHLPSRPWYSHGRAPCPEHCQSVAVAVKLKKKKKGNRWGPWILTLLTFKFYILSGPCLPGSSSAPWHRGTLLPPFTKRSKGPGCPGLPGTSSHRPAAAPSFLPPRPAPGRSAGQHLRRGPARRGREARRRWAGWAAPGSCCWAGRSSALPSGEGRQGRGPLAFAPGVPSEQQVEGGAELRLDSEGLSAFPSGTRGGARCAPAARSLSSEASGWCPAGRVRPGGRGRFGSVAAVALGPGAAPALGERCGTAAAWSRGAELPRRKALSDPFFVSYQQILIYFCSDTLRRQRVLSSINRPQALLQ